MEIRKQILLLIHLDKADSHSTLALIYSKQKQYEKSMEHCKMALQISTQLVRNGDKIERIGGIFEDISEIYMGKNDMKKARKYYKKALKYYKPPNHLFKRYFEFSKICFRWVLAPIFEYSPHPSNDFFHLHGQTM